jgi:hypothetical protein
MFGFLKRLFGSNSGTSGGGTLSQEAEELEYDLFLQRALNELQLKTTAHDRTWQLGQADWEVDQDDGQIVFTSPSGIVATCPVQIIGSYNSEDSTWLWGWDHPSVVPALAEHAQLVRKYGESKGITELTHRKLETTEDVCWKFAALACKLADAQGAYRGPAGPTYIFMTFGTPSLSGDGVEDGPAKLRGKEVAAADIPAEIRGAILGYQQDIYAFQVACNGIEDELPDEGLPEEEAKEVRREQSRRQRELYKQLIQDWYASGVKPQGYTYDRPAYDAPPSVKFWTAVKKRDRWIVKTEEKKPEYMGLSTSSREFEYHLVNEDGKWRMKSRLYVDDEGKWECL